eukprot:2379576-Amphidinium_carterae.1
MLKVYELTLALLGLALAPECAEISEEVLGVLPYQAFHKSCTGGVDLPASLSNLLQIPASCKTLNSFESN